MTYCLDTNIVVDFLRGNKIIIEKIRNISLHSDLSITCISLCELFKGAFLSSRSEKELIIINDFLDSVKVLDLNIDSCQTFGQEYSRLNKIGKQTKEFDLMIASISRANGLILITRDKKDFENIDVKLEVW